MIVPISLEVGETMDPEDQGREAICQGQSLQGAHRKRTPTHEQGASLHCRAEKERGG